jgi:hypothetical protein
VRGVLAPRADHQHGAGTVAGADEHVLGAGRAVQEVPLPKRPLLAVEDDDALTVEHEEVLLHRLRVVAAVGLPRLHHLDVHAQIGPGRVVVLEVDEGRST